MDSTTGIRANVSRHELIKHEGYDLSPTQLQDDGIFRKSEGPIDSSTSVSKSGSSEFTPESSTKAVSGNGPMTGREIITVAVLCFINLINYMDRFTIAGILTDVQCQFGVGDAEGGLLQTAFIASYMIFAPLFGYLGDRYSRKAIMALGIFIWSLTTLLGSFVDQNFWMFLTLRALVGIGEASYSTIAPTIISDLFVSDRRSNMLALFYFAIPVGSGLGYIVGSGTAQLMGGWQWGLRVTPIAGALAVILTMTVVQDPPRGSSEGSHHLVPTSWADDIRSLCKNRSFMLTTWASTAVAFVAGALAWWGPKFITLGLARQGNKDASMGDVSFVFGIIAMTAGLLGVPLGSLLGQKLRVRYQRADPLVCGVGLLASVPFMLAGLFVADWNTNVCYALIFFGQLLLNINWSIVADIVLYVVIPTRRSTAEAFQILLSHAFGDAGSPYLIGQVSEILKKVLAAPVAEATDAGTNEWLNVSATVKPETSCFNSTIDFDSVDVDFPALEYSLLITIFVEVLGGLFFLFTAWYIVKDKARVDRAVQGCYDPDDSSSTSSRNRKPLYSGECTPEEEEPITIRLP